MVVTTWETCFRTHYRRQKRWWSAYLLFFDRLDQETIFDGKNLSVMNTCVVSSVLPTLVGSAWSAQPLPLPPLKADLPPLVERKVLKCYILAKFNHHSTHPGQNYELDSLLHASMTTE